MVECPHCGKQLGANAAVCRYCLHVDEAARARHEAGQLGADGRGGGRELEDPGVGPIPASGSGMAAGLAGVATAGLRLVTTGLLLRRRRRRDQSDA